MKFITPTVHGLLDYAAASALIIIPFALGFNGLSLWLSVAAGAGLIVYSLLTDYAYSAAKVIPFSVHLTADILAAALFVIAPFVFGFGSVETAYYIVMGLGVLVVVAFTSKEQSIPAASESPIAADTAG
jgi:hypothetical protein